MERVLLLHGLWMRGFTLSRMAGRLRAAGFSVQALDYGTIWQGPQAAVEQACSRIAAVGEPLHLVGHSLGGMVALECARRDPSRVGRVVCLGSPLSGSHAANVLSHWPGGGAVLGRSGELLARGVDAWAGANPVGVIAGRLPLGFGFLFGGLGSPHDGTVAVSETRLPGLADHIEVTTTHTGLLFSAEAARQTIAFLRTGRFRR
ncbi:MAG TPA: alpha/beta hydrolase [Xanthomonadaceae bacterium]|nr:alpha/beta hydrolase [Xanthomonadaceae bacterium]